jgi:ATP phosphoribosyltransferase regulatory subunit
MLKKNNNTMIADRSIREILNRFKNKINDPRRISKGKKVSKIIQEFLKIQCPISDAAKNLNVFFKKNNINLLVDQSYFPISKNNTSKLKVKFSTSFGRELEYYTGIVFEISIKVGAKNLNIINGGRYDKLIASLGGGKKIPAVGAAINL